MLVAVWGCIGCARDLLSPIRMTSDSPVDNLGYPSKKTGLLTRSKYISLALLFLASASLSVLLRACGYSPPAFENLSVKNFRLNFSVLNNNS